MRIAVVGMGYVGLSNAIILAQHNDVLAVDVCNDKILRVDGAAVFKCRAENKRPIITVL